MSSENVITIKLEIEIPVGEGIGVPNVKTTTRRRDVEIFNAHAVNQPAGSVPCRWDGTTGWVCASGTAIEGGVPAKVLCFELNLLSWPGLAEIVAIAVHLTDRLKSQPRVAWRYRRPLLAKSLPVPLPLDLSKGLIEVQGRWA